MNQMRCVSLHGVTMRVFHSEGEVNSDTVLRFEQIGNVFSARYQGGGIVDGYLIGHVAERGDVLFRYVQADASGRLDQGVSTGVVVRLEDGRLQLTEDFQWLTRPGTGRNVFIEDRKSGDENVDQVDIPA